jgi:hypothetical protein
MKIMVLIVCALGFEVFTKGIFLSPRNITLLLRQTAINGVLATGMVFVIVSGNIDLSIGSGVALSGATLAILETWHEWSTTSAVIVVIGIGILMGVFNGFWTVRSDLHKRHKHSSFERFYKDDRSGFYRKERFHNHFFRHIRNIPGVLDIQEAYDKGKQADRTEKEAHITAFAFYPSYNSDDLRRIRV